MKLSGFACLLAAVAVANAFGKSPFRVARVLGVLLPLPTNSVRTNV